jgi:hypothetical protein
LLSFRKLTGANDCADNQDRNQDTAPHSVPSTLRFGANYSPWWSSPSSIPFEQGPSPHRVLTSYRRNGSSVSGASFGNFTIFAGTITACDRALEFWLQGPSLSCAPASPTPTPDGWGVSRFASMTLDQLAPGCVAINAENGRSDTILQTRATRPGSFEASARACRPASADL